MTILFEQIYVLTLEKNKEKQAIITEHLGKLDIGFEFWYGFNGNDDLTDEEIAKYTVSPAARAFSRGERKPMTKGEYGCLKSHADIARDARKRGFNGYLVLEDDARVAPDFWERIKQLESEFPADTELLFLGNIFYGKKLPIRKKYQLTEHIWNFKTMNIMATHAFIVREAAYDRMIDLWESFDDIADLKIISAAKKEVVKGYCMLPYCAYQADGRSDINNKNRDMVSTRRLYSDDMNTWPGVNENDEVHPEGKWPTQLF